MISKQDLAKNIKVGMRMPSFKVLNQADARPWHLQELLKSRGCWRLVIFAGNIKNKQQKGSRSWVRSWEGKRASSRGLPRRIRDTIA